MSAEPRPPPAPAAGEEFGLAKGATVGRYVVLGLLGRGGMGEVYAAYDPDLDRKIALKLLRARGGSSDADGRTRLLREAQAIARLSHPNVVVVFDVGTFRESVFIAMEFVEGHTLGYWIEAQNRSWREVLEVYAAAGRGLIAAHTAGLVHRDFKPENVMITKSGQVRVMDFGLAREQGAPEDGPPAGQPPDLAAQAAALAETFESGVDLDATAKLGGAEPGAAPPSASGGYLKLKLTQTGAMLGTPAYMAPEQFAGIGGDARTDQFSFCVALYEGLYRQRPFAGNNAVELMANVLAGKVSDPPADARVPTWIRKILVRGLSTSPDDRFPSMAALLAALAQDPAVRRRRWLGAAVGVAVLLAATTGARRFVAGHQMLCAAGPDRAATAWGSDHRAAIERAFAATGSRDAPRAFAAVASLIDQYVARWTAMYRETCEATHVRGEQSSEVLDLRMGCLGDRLSSVRALGEVFMTAADPGVVDNAVSAASALPALDRCADVEMLRAVIKPPDDPAVRAKVAAVRERIAKLKALSDSGQCETAARLEGGVVTDAQATGYLPVQAEAHFAAGLLADTCTDLARAIEHLQDAAIAAEASRHDEVYVESSATMAVFYGNRLHDVRRARESIRHAVAVLSRFPGHRRLEARVADGEAVVAMSEGRPEEALLSERRSLDLLQQVVGPEHYEVASTRNNLAVELHELHRDAEAEPLIESVVQTQTRLFGPESSRVAVALLNQAEILTALRRFAEARRAIDGALAIWRKQNAASSLIGYGLLDLGQLQEAEGNPGTATRTLEQAIGLIGDEDRMTAAQAKFALARATWAASPRNRTKARDLARVAREMAAAQAGAARLVGEISAWESAHTSI
ncbi:MAG TPA: serine/threonine-protein kinase [Polyangia bacterium]|nr:serine/threonine-protein kinase [Polyangia bacterium]